jgi:dipeptidyl-peptidase-4
MGPTAEYYLDTFSRSQNRRAELCIATVRNGRAFASRDQVLTDEYALQPTEIVQLKTQDGKLLYGRLIKPANFHAGEKYPAVVMVYGGPGVQTVTQCVAGRIWDGMQVLAARGFVIWQLDNRGSSGRGHAFETPAVSPDWENRAGRSVGRRPLSDRAGLRRSGARGNLRLELRRFMTLYSLLNAPDVFRAGIAGAPVTNWRNYDTIYTERYLGLPSENPEGYAPARLWITRPKLKAKLLIVHNIEDDNVLFQNTVQMADALEQAGKLFDMVIYPEKEPWRADRCKDNCSKRLRTSSRRI